MPQTGNQCRESPSQSERQTQPPARRVWSISRRPRAGSGGLGGCHAAALDPPNGGIRLTVFQRQADRPL
jgi:hypothetical protein